MKAMKKSRESMIKQERGIRAPQISIYNRNFYLRGAEHQLIQEQKCQEIKQLANKPKITPSSYHILSLQLENRLTATFLQNSQMATDRLEEVELEFDGLQSIMQTMCGFRVDNELEHFCSQLWLILGSYEIREHVRGNLLFATLRILMDPFNLSISECQQMLNQIEEFRMADQRRVEFVERYPDLGEETLQVPRFLKLWKRMRYRNPHFTDCRHELLERPHVHEQVPKINPKSKQLARESLDRYLHTSQALHNPNPDLSHYRTEPNELSEYIKENKRGTHASFIKPSCHQILHHRKLAKDKIAMPRPDKSLAEEKPAPRTARPEQIDEIVNSLYVVKQKRDDIDYNSIREQKELQLCTFSPRVNPRYDSMRSVSASRVIGFDSQVGRVKKGREEKEKKKQALENLGRVKKSAIVSKSASKSVAPSFLARDIPKLILEIDIGGGRIEKLLLKGDEDPHLVSKKFVHMYGLQEDMLEVLESLVEHQLRSLV